MIDIRPGRVRPGNRKQTETDKTPSAQVKSWLAPIAGWVTADPLAGSTPNSAMILENFWPTASGIEPRGGTKLRVTIPNAVSQMFQYHFGTVKRFFVADENNIYSFNSSTPYEQALTAEIIGQTRADYGVVAMQTDAGGFLTVVNGYDSAQIFDGTSWQKVTTTSTPFAITNVDTDRFSYGWVYNNREYFIETGTMNVWYLGVNSVAGSATKLPLNGIFKRGGSLLFGATWSSDSGSGIDDRCVFATDNGEFAVYTGDPGSGNWQLVGVFDIGEPMGKNAHFSIGGDLLIATKAGLIPISSAVQNDTTRLKLASLTKNIDPSWRREVVLAGNLVGWSIQKWESRNMVTIAPPNLGASQGYCLAVNLETGAWTKFTGWDVGDFEVFDDFLHFGNSQGQVFICDTGGTDNGSPFECRACFSFDALGSQAAYKTAHAIRGVWKYRTPILVKHSLGRNYKPVFPDTPNSALYEGTVEGEWDVSFWDQDFWATSEADYDYKEGWVSTGIHGLSIAPQVQLLSASDFKLDCELVSIDLTYSTGGVVV